MRTDSGSPTAPGRAPLSPLVRRALARRCPRCGGAGVWRGWFRTVPQCPACGLVFDRGESSDFWLGAYLINLVVAEVSAVAIAAALWLTMGSRLSFNVLWGASMLLAVLMPVAFYPLSRGLWLAVDLHVRPAETGDRHG
jgi:uncharacterized protein (DUF983 family)